ncbi:MAG: ABC transporter permease [Micromonosporaceae bacterium]
MRRALMAVHRALRANRVVRGALGGAAVLAAAEIAVRTGLVDQVLLPPPSVVVARAFGLLANGQFLSDVGATLTAWAYALALTVAIAVPLGVILGAIRWADTTTRPVLEFLRPIPSVTLIPLVLLVMRNDLRTEVAVIVYASLWPVLINTIYGVRDTDPVTRETLRSFGFGPLAVMRRVSVPSAAPFIVTGIRLAASIGLIVAIGAELIGSSGSGVGAFLIEAQSGGGHVDLMLAATLWAGLLGLGLNAAFVRMERRAFPWHHALAGEGT